jgi:threonine dehydrogenase-like Zn-dependent dehydrogenase
MATERTRALVFIPRLAKLEIRDLPLPRLDSDDVLVRILSVGLTVRDAAMISRGAPRLPPGDDYLVLGHTALGRVEETGSLVRNLSPGDLVAPVVRRDCGRCIDGRPDLCSHPGRIGDAGLAGAHGFARVHLVEKARQLVRIAPEVGDCGILLHHLAEVEKAYRDLIECRHGSHFYCYHDRDPSMLPALVTGINPSSFLAACLLSLHGSSVTVMGRREADDARARLFSPLGVEYRNPVLTPWGPGAEGGYKVLFDTTCDAVFLSTLLPLMANNAALVLLRAPETAPPLEMDASAMLRRLVAGNLMVLGSNGAGRDAYEAGARQLQEICELYQPSIRGLIDERFPFDDFARALAVDFSRAIFPVLDLA